jgi:hypothetical protein
VDLRKVIMNTRFGDQTNAPFLKRFYSNGTGASAAVARGIEPVEVGAVVNEPIAVLVDAATFSELLISKQDLKRSDPPNSNQLGLYDSCTGVRYVISESDLFRAELFRAAM